MNHIIQIETESGNIPVGHYEFAAVTGQVSGFNDTACVHCFKLLNHSGSTVVGTLEIELTCDAQMAKYRIPLSLTSSSVISATGSCVFESTSDKMRCLVVKGRISHTDEDSVPTKVGVIALIPENYGWWQFTSVKATFNARNVEVVFLPNIAITTVDSKQDVGTRQSLPVLTSADFGIELPDPGNSGRIFFLEVQDE